MLSSADLLTPAGEIDGAQFYPSLSSLDVSALIDAYATQGYAKATEAGISDSGTADKIARKFAYYRAWSDVVNRLTLSPASASLAGDVSTSYLQTQIDEWITKRDSWLADFQALIPTETPTRAVSRTVVTAPVF